jgi:hypothetical protein
MNISETAHRLSSYVIVGLVMLAAAGPAAAKGGRMAVILDNSTSMSSVGSNFDDIKQSLFDALLVLPGAYETGLRVFDASTNGSRLISPYSADLDPLYQALQGVSPSTGATYIGQSILDAVDDIAANPGSDNYLLMVTDGEGSSSDIQAARNAKQKLGNVPGKFTCDFILFSSRKDAWNQTPIGQVAKELGCKLAVQEGRVTAQALTPALLRIFGVNFYWLWIILSAIAYTALIILTAYLIFDVQYARGVLPRLARLTALGFIASIAPGVAGAHLLGLFAGIAGIIWGLIALSLAIVVIAAIGIGRSQKHSTGGSYDSNDPFA